MARDDHHDIKLNGTSYAVMGLLDVTGPSTPYDLKRFIERSVENFWPVPHTSFYAEPDRLARAGYLAVEQEGGGRRRKVYALTDRGREALHAWRDDGQAAPPQLRDEMMLKVFLGADPAPMLAPRIAFHRAKIAELEGYLELVRGDPAHVGMERSLITGIAYSRAMVDMLERFSAPTRPSGSGP
jgi:DNA-binding PadR family transcriptional regulator